MPCSCVMTAHAVGNILLACCCANFQPTQLHTTTDMHCSSGALPQLQILWQGVIQSFRYEMLNARAHWQC